MKIKIAIQKSGRLHEDSVQLLQNCGIHFQNGHGQLRTTASNFPMELLFLRDDDIPQYVADGVADIGIVGENVVKEKNKQTLVIDHLGFARCRLSIAVPRNTPYDGIQSLAGKKIATSYPRLLQQFLVEQQVDAEIHEISGSVEIAPGIGLADAICDLVSSGSTLLTNGLREVEVVLRSEALMISKSNLSQTKRKILDQLMFRIHAVNAASKNKYILLNAPNDKLPNICKILPGIKSPTILPLAESGWSSLHSVVKEDDFWAIIENLKAQGAQGILIIPIEKMIA